MSLLCPVISGFKEHQFLSNFYESSVLFGGIRFATSEHAYQYRKFDDENVRQKILNAQSPGKAKRLAKAASLVHPYTEGFVNSKKDVMYRIVKAKFLQNDDIAAQLIATDDALIIETNSWGDDYWGVDKNGKGENHLGVILMRVRKILMIIAEINKHIAALQWFVDMNKNNTYYSSEDRHIADAETSILNMSIKHFESLAEFVKNS